MTLNTSTVDLGLLFFYCKMTSNLTCVSQVTLPLSSDLPKKSAIRSQRFKKKFIYLFFFLLLSLTETCLFSC